MVAGVMGYELSRLDVEVQGDVDLRGSLAFPSVPAGFQRMRVNARVALANGGAAEIRKVLAMAEACCVVGQTLRGGVAVEFAAEE
jgi:organic hydroperoxide reductase OsmC/OhrA